MGWVGSALIVLALTRRDMRQLHRINLAAALILMTFNLIMGIPSMIALNVVLALVNSYKLWGDRLRRIAAPAVFRSPATRRRALAAA